MLRDYQKEAINAVLAYLRVNRTTRHPLVVAPTGSGKTHIISGLCKKIHEKYPDFKILLLSHVKEILEQDEEKLACVIPSEKIGVYSAGIGRREVKQYTIASIQSVYKKAELFQDFKLVIVDEAHTIPPGSEGRYRTFLDAMPNVPVVGLTATPFRLGSGYLTDEGHLFDEIVYTIDIKRLIKDGYLCKLRSKAAKEQIDTSKFKVVAGDYSKKSLSEHVDRFNITATICDELVARSEGRRHWLVFAVDIKHAEHIAEALSERGVSAAPYHSKMSAEDKALFMRLYKAGHIKAVINVNSLTTGFDFPEIDLIALLRPTKSPVLHVQMIGRGLRIHESKEYTLILDFAGNLQRLGPIDKIEVEPPKNKGKGGGQAPVKTCPQCDEVCLIKALKCDACGWEFEFNTNLTRIASESSVISSDEEIENKLLDVKVNKVYYYKHEKKDKPPSLKVVYVTNNARTYNEWIPIESPQMHGLVRKWWKRRSGRDVPMTTDAAILLAEGGHLLQPTKITVDTSGKYPTIKQYSFVVDYLKEVH